MRHVSGKLFHTRVNTLRGLFAGLAVCAALVACHTLDDEEIALDDESTGEFQPSTDGLGLWTQVRRPPYHIGVPALSRRLLELAPETAAGGDITLAASLRWRDQGVGAVDPQVSFGLVGTRGESTLLQVFENDGMVRGRFDLEMTDLLEVGVWYRVVLTITEAPGRPVQARIYDDRGSLIWRSCSDAACPATQLDDADLAAVRLRITVDDMRQDNGQIEIKDISLQRNP